MPHVRQVWIDDTSATLQLTVEPSLDYFPGHFPDHPILPGIVQVDWVIRLARQHLGIRCTGFSALRALKFSAPILPGTKLSLQIDWLPERQRLDFAYREERRPMSSGQIFFASGAAA
ncbi:hydroxymyristoyl-ACP dehydratase [Accumulibacter sp.]|uniref:3-hydroxyacyl-ACP dehydratase FabZ family protein n=1 Tax=Accumulibacter sp. TaxID=2053492 RepID=UPI0025CFDDC7|nr:hydroxymyristoyl-ACP dehydratase [Accumulibacter sp.]MCM8614094.1 hydroxymyristoyl-ACP dehydratase [Accumulibacter sp.]MCM8637882.1 hydroxymyristoyl-ACP dehydratase [Accumulibacter sp.]MCM8641289.1 hydroxymyristoyl-ACP dehydratase [Accumulibacter sp.]